MPFEFATAARVRFGPGTAAEVPEIVRGLSSKRVLLVTGRSRHRAEQLREGLKAVGREFAELAVTGEPTLELVRAGAQQAIANKCEAVVAFGGGSAIDAAKAVAALATNRGDPRDYVEVIGRGRVLEQPSLPVVAMPTTAGTGSEVTRNAVLLSRQDRVKVSLRSPFLLPTVAIIDPDLLAGAPREVLLASGLDALSQLIEPFISGRANPLTDTLAREGIRRSARALRRSVLDGTDARATARIWRWPACWAACAWPTPAWAPCTASPPPRAACWRPPTAPSAPPCWPRWWPSTCARCRPAPPPTPPCPASRRSPAC